MFQKESSMAVSFVLCEFQLPQQNLIPQGHLPHFVLFRCFDPRLQDGTYQANSAQIDRRQGPEEAACHQGVTEVAVSQILLHKCKVPHCILEGVLCRLLASRPQLPVVSRR